MRTRWLIALVSVVALLASACDSAQNEQPAETDSDGETQVDAGVQQRLQDAIATTGEQGPVEFTATSQRAIDAGSSAGTDADESPSDDGVSGDVDDEDAATDGDRTTQVDIEGVVDFDQGLRKMSLVPGRSTRDAEVSVLLEQDDLYVQLADDASGDDPANAQWGRLDKDELVGVESRASQMLLHDPYPMLQALQNATIDVREGTPIGAADNDDDSVEDEGATADEGGPVDDGLADQPDIIASVDLTETDQSALEALAKQMSSDELDILVWVEPAVEDDDGEETADGNVDADEMDDRIQQLAISLPAEAAGELGGTEDDRDAGDDDVDDSAEGSDAGADAVDDDWELMIELTSFGSEAEIEAPEDDEVVEIGVDELRAMLGGQREGVESTPTPDADGDDGTGTDS